ncbi:MULTISPECIES: DUF1269 domain-containing protein [unclassified Desulfovibrio]|uniref:DUF1269 domain-containing protein n=1 Tax=unclassified Desulfovibrio TaxID=2593640 RepID=UPI0013EBDF65|nr:MULTISPECIES: DUF1269 domain-containing protein [unclassified Desulfovibrio]MDE7371648.1 DUF1269 domain-containing protein [Desulfovibrio sp.]
MSTLIVIVYPDELQAEQVRLDFIKMQKEYLVSLEDAVIAVKKPDGKVKLHQMYNLTLGGAMSGGLWGTLIGLIFLNPLLGLVVGAGAGAVAGALSDVGINDDFMKNLASTLKPGSSALFVLVDSAITDKVRDALAGTGGKIIQTSLSTPDQEKLQQALDEARKQIAAAQPEQK